MKKDKNVAKENRVKNNIGKENKPKRPISVKETKSFTNLNNSFKGFKKILSEQKQETVVNNNQSNINIQNLNNDTKNNITIWRVKEENERLKNEVKSLKKQLSNVKKKNDCNENENKDELIKKDLLLKSKSRIIRKQMSKILK